MKRLALSALLILATACDGARNTKKQRDEKCARNLDCNFGLDCAETAPVATAADGGTVTAGAAGKTCQYHLFGDCEGDGTSPGGQPQCVSGQKCRDGHCTVQCAGKSDCQEGEVCKIGICQRGRGTNYSQCYDNRDCPYPETCYYGQCVTRTDAGRCQTDLDCGAGGRCIDGRCM